MFFKSLEELAFYTVLNTKSNGDGSNKTFDLSEISRILGIEYYTTKKIYEEAMRKLSVPYGFHTVLKEQMDYLTKYKYDYDEDLYYT